MNLKCQACGFTVFNRRYPKCESCGVILAPGLALTDAERNALFESERLSAEEDRKKRERDNRKKSDKDSPSFRGINSI
jgi:hypothetical protein